MDFQKKAVGAKLFLARKHKNLTQTQVAKQIGIHQTQYQRIEKGIIGIDAKKLLTLCSILNLNADELIQIYSTSQQKKVDSFSINDPNEIRRIAEIEIAKRDKIIAELKKELKALTKYFSGETRFVAKTISNKGYNYKYSSLIA